MDLTEDEIRPDRLKNGQARACAIDIERLLSQKNEFVFVNCPACNSNESKDAFQKQGYNYVTCNNCGTLFTNPRPSPKILDDYYAHSESYAYWSKFILPASENVRREKIFRPRAQKFAEICKRYNIKRKTLLEVGAGFGIFCEEIGKLGLFEKVIAVEPTPELAETCRRKGLDVIQKPIEQVHLKNESVDVVACFEVIEHLFDPREFIKSCASLLSPGGLLILSCPNVKGFDIAVLQELSDNISKDHLNYFNATSLSNLVRSIGFEVKDISTPGKLDAELVRKKILNNEFDVSRQPFLKTVLLDRWEDVSFQFQQFLADNQLSSHLWLVAQKNDISNINFGSNRE